MATENGKAIVTRAAFLSGRTIERVQHQRDADGLRWTVLYLDNGAQVHIQDDAGWVLVDAEIH